MDLETPRKVRISKALSAGETQAIATRREEVKKGLAKLNITGGKIPTIAVLGSGGGLRAMIALYGTLTELKNQYLLDCVMYLGGVSGSTWCMSKLYKHEDWSENINILETMESEILTQGHWDFLKAQAAVIEASEVKNYSLTDFWAYFIVHELLKQMDESKLSEQRGSSENGKNPYPIYAAVDYKRFSNHQPGSWYEFTPHEVGIAGLNASINTKDFGSEFENGLLIREKNEKTICYLQGLWGSAPGSKTEVERTLYDKLTHILQIERRHTSRQSPTGSHGKKSLEQPSKIDPANLSATDGSEPKEKHHRVEKILRGAESASADQVPHSTTGLTDYLWETLKYFRHCIWETATNLCHYYCPHFLLEILQWIEETATNMLTPYSLSEIWEAVKYMNRWTWANTDLPYDCIDDFSETKKCFSNGSRGTSNETTRQSNNLNEFRLQTYLGILETLKCFKDWTWGTTYNFLYRCSEVDSHELIQEPIVCLIDAGLAINTAYPLIVRPERKVDLILSFDFSNGDPFKTLIKTAEYCEADGNTGLRFPKINVNELQDKDNPSDCYIFRGQGAATVMHIPLFNRVNCPGKIEEYHRQYSTFNLGYSEQEIEKLLIAAKKNVINVHQKILEEIRRIVE